MLEPEDVIGTYAKLLSPRQDTDDLAKHIENLTGEKFQTRVGRRASNSRQISGGYISSVPEPLKGLRLILTTDGQEYSGDLSFQYDGKEEANETARRNLSKNPKNKIITLNGVLFLLGEDPMFSLSLASATYETYNHLSFGDSGTCKRRLSTLSQFETDFNKLCEIGTEVLNSFYDTPTPNYKIKMYV